MNIIKPITPAEALVNKNIPDEVIKAFNLCISKNLSSKVSAFTQEEVISECISFLKDANHRLIMNKSDEEIRQIIFKNKWLNIESIFEDVGWDVEYDKPSYAESYLAKFIFAFK